MNKCVAVLALGLWGCSSVLAPGGGKEGFRRNVSDFKTLALRSDFTYEDSERRVSGNVQWRTQKDSLLWVSITPTLPIEMLRLLIRPDSLFVLERMQKSYLQLPLSDLKKWLGFELPNAYHTLQAALLGALPYETKHFKVKQKNSVRLILTKKDKLFSIRCGLDPKTERVLWWVLQDKKERRLVCDYAYRESPQDIDLPKEVKLKLFHQSNKLFSLELKHKNVALNKTLNYPFRVPERYEQRGSKD